jgi:fimbrial chaperone protein
LVLSLSAVGLAGGAELSIDPVRVTLSRSSLAAQLLVGNSGDVPDLLQSQVFVWTRQHCVDVLEPTENLVVSPPIFTLQPDGKQVVRVLLTGQVPDGQESTMRVVLTEIGPLKDVVGEITTRLSLSLPVFVSPKATAAPKLEWTVNREGSRLRVMAHNIGNAHTRLRTFKVAAAGGATLSEESHTDYLLAGDSCEWALPADKLLPGSHLVAVTEERETTLEIPAS